MEIAVGKYLFSPLFFLLIITGFIGFGLSIFLFKRRRIKSVIFLSVWELAAGIWSLTYAFEYASIDVALKIFWSKLSYFGIVFCPVSFFFFSLAYSARVKYTNKKLIRFIYGLGFFFIFTVLTNDWHHLHWKSVSIYPETHTTEYVYGPLFWGFYIYTYSLLLAGIFNLNLLYFKFPERFKSQIGFFILAALFPITGNIMYVFNVNPFPGFDWTPLMFMISGILLSINIFKFGFFNLVPFARDKLIDIMPDGVMVADSETRIVDVNPAMLEILRTDERKLIGKLYKELFPQWEYLIQEQGVDKENRSEISIILDGEERHFDFQSTPLFDKKHNFTGILVSLRDVTEHRIIENKLHKAYDQLKSEIIEKEKLIVDLDAFSHTVAHNLKNMLGAIVTSTDLLRDSIHNNQYSDVDEILELLDLSSRKTLHVTRELLLLASVRQQEIRTTVIDMTGIVEEAIVRNFNLVSERKAEFVKPEQWLPCIGYAPWIEEVWANYISNAIKYGGMPPCITMGSEKMKNGHVKYWIKDNGAGISLDQQERLFSKFTRLDELKIEGHGLGLSISKRIIEKLGGTVGVESENTPDKGSTFYFTLPSCPNEQAPDTIKKGRIVKPTENKH